MDDMRTLRAAVEPWRKLALALLFIGISGIATELLLLGHYEDKPQWAPLAFLAIGIVAVVVVLVRPSRLNMQWFRVIMASYLPAAIAGFYFHINSNVEFELEMRPSMAGLELVRESMTGAIPALAPGAMAQLGLIGLLVCFRHPALRGPAQAKD